MKITDDLVTRVAARVHHNWIGLNQKAGVTSAALHNGEEGMVAYDQLSEEARKRGEYSSRFVLQALAEVVEESRIRKEAPVA